MELTRQEKIEVLKRVLEHKDDTMSLGICVLIVAEMEQVFGRSFSSRYASKYIPEFNREAATEFGATPNHCSWWWPRTPEGNNMRREFLTAILSRLVDEDNISVVDRVMGANGFVPMTQQDLDEWTSYIEEYRRIEEEMLYTGSVRFARPLIRPPFEVALCEGLFYKRNRK